jgi:hypothetical protein
MKKGMVMCTLKPPESLIGLKSLHNITYQTF